MMEVRVTRPDEIEAARQLTDRSWLATYPPLIGEAETRRLIAEKHSPQKFAEQYETGRDQFLVAVSDGTIIGHCWGFPKDGFYIDRLHVDPEWKGQGAGRALLAASQSLLTEGSRFWLDVLKGNDAALAFYERVGFSRGGETEGLAGIPAIIMEKTAQHG